MKWILKRLSEPSTMAGISATAQAVYATLYAGMPLSVAIPVALTGLMAVLKSDGGK